MSMQEIVPQITKSDRDYLDLLRGMSITRVVLVHLGLSWFLPPYSEYVHTFMPLLFFVSGAVSYFSFLRSKNLLLYLYKRIASIYVPYAFLIIVLFLFRCIYLGYIPKPNIMLFFDYLTLNFGEMKNATFPLGQVWFLHSLIVIVLLSSLIFMTKIGNHKFFFSIIMLISIGLSAIQFFINIHPFFYLTRHNFYHPLVYIGFFLFGSWYYSNKETFNGKILLYLMGISLFVFLTLFILTQNIGMNIHATKPDLYYVSLSYFFVCFVLFFRDSIIKLNKRMPGLTTFFLFMSKHSYSVFLLHSLVLWYVHNELGLSNVMASPEKAALKIVLVILITCIFAMPYSYMANYLRNKVIFLK